MRRWRINLHVKWFCVANVYTLYNRLNAMYLRNVCDWWMRAILLFGCQDCLLVLADLLAESNDAMIYCEAGINGMAFLNLCRAFLFTAWLEVMSESMLSIVPIENGAAQKHTRTFGIRWITMSQNEGWIHADSGIIFVVDCAFVQLVKYVFIGLWWSLWNYTVTGFSLALFLPEVGRLVERKKNRSAEKKKWTTYLSYRTNPLSWMVAIIYRARQRLLHLLILRCTSYQFQVPPSWSLWTDPAFWTHKRYHSMEALTQMSIVTNANQ